jgi:hypothetical protein
MRAAQGASYGAGYLEPVTTVAVLKSIFFPMETPANRTDRGAGYPGRP